MKQTLKFTSLILLLAFVVVSCENHPSLQKYYIDSKESADFISIDIPASILELKNEEVSDEVKETLKTIKKFNFLGYQLTKDNKEGYAVEKEKVNTILKNPKYQELIRFNQGTKSFNIKFLGEDDAIDEVIIFGSDKELGFLLIRILGDKMDPSKIITLVNDINIDDDNGSFKQLESFISNIK